MHLGPAERLVVGLLAGRHLDQRRAGEEHLGPLLDHDHVVAHAGDVGTAGGGVAEHDGDRGLLARRGAGEVAEASAARDEDLLLGGEVGAAGLGEVDRRQPVLLGDLRGAEGLAQRPRVEGAALHRRVVGDDHALDALDHADAGHDAGADREVTAPAGQRHQLQERRPLVDEQLDALAGGELAALLVAGDVLAAGPDGLGLLGVQRLDLLEHGSPSIRHPSSTAFILSRVVRMSRSLERPRSPPSTSQ